MDSIDLDISKARDLTKVERIGSHSHIKGLGLKAGNGIEPLINSNGMVGQLKARKAAGFVVKLVEQGKIPGRGILFVGPPGTGKTAIAMGMSQELGKDVPFNMISGSEIYSLEMSKVEALTQAIRRSIGIKIREIAEIIEGEVVEVRLEKTLPTGSKNNMTKKGTLTIKTTDMETIYELGGKMIDYLYKEKIIAGDVIMIDKANSRITKLGRSYSRAKDFDTFGSDTKFVKCPEGELQKSKEVTHLINLHEIDVINNSNTGYLSIFSGNTGEIKKEVREMVNWKLDEWKNDGKVEIIPGVLFIDEVDLLDMECFSFLNRALEQGCFNSGYSGSSLKGLGRQNHTICDTSPVLIFATNKLYSEVNRPDSIGGDIPEDLLDRCLVVHTKHYDYTEKLNIIKTRSMEEDIEMTEDALDYLVGLTETTESLRYSILLMTTSYFIAKRENIRIVELRHVKRSYDLFLDQKRSLEFCR